MTRSSRTRLAISYCTHACSVGENASTPVKAPSQLEDLIPSLTYIVWAPWSAGGDAKPKQTDDEVS